MFFVTIGITVFVAALAAHLVGAALTGAFRKR
jgi:hypothetical protein